MKKMFILFALTLTTSVFAADLTPEKIIACSEAHFLDANYYNDCISSNASAEKISACASVGYLEDSYLNQCISLTRATPSKIAACLTVGYQDPINLNDCLATNAELFKISACASLGMDEESINKCIKKI